MQELPYAGTHRLASFENRRRPLPHANLSGGSCTHALQKKGSTAENTRKRMVVVHSLLMAILPPPVLLSSRIRERLLIRSIAFDGMSRLLSGPTSEISEKAGNAIRSGPKSKVGG
jgi:hypothetical protein